MTTRLDEDAGSYRTFEKPPEIGNRCRIEGESEKVKHFTVSSESQDQRVEGLVLDMSLYHKQGSVVDCHWYIHLRSVATACTYYYEPTSCHLG